MKNQKSKDLQNRFYAGVPFSLEEFLYSKLQKSFIYVKCHPHAHLNQKKEHIMEPLSALTGNAINIFKHIFDIRDTVHGFDDYFFRT